MNEPPVVYQRETDDPRTHVERIDDLEGPKDVGLKEPLAPTVHAYDEQPIDQRWPYRTTAKAVISGMLLPPGQLQWLYPHEVARHHVLARDVLDSGIRDPLLPPEPEAA